MGGENFSSDYVLNYMFIATSATYILATGIFAYFDFFQRNSKYFSLAHTSNAMPQKDIVLHASDVPRFV